MTRVLATPERSLDALRAVVAARERAEHVTLVLRGCDSRAVFAVATTPHILRSTTGYDERRAAFDALASGSLVIDGRPMNDCEAIDSRFVKTLRDAARCADAIEVASWTQWERVAPLLDLPYERASIAVDWTERPSIESADRRGAVVVYAPKELPALVAFCVFALQEMRAPILVVGDTSLCEGMRFVSETGPRALGCARAVIIPALDDPAVALGIAAIDAALVAPFTSGIDEYCSGVARYAPWDRLSLLGGVQAALGADRPRVHAVPTSAGTDAFALPTDGDLVTIVIRTCDRRAMFERAIASVAAQTYRALEIVVVNDGSEPVEDVVEGYPNARIVGNSTRLGAIPSLNVGLRAARGRWFGWLDDDDRLFPDHVARLVDALERSGGVVAHADTLSEYFERQSDGSYRPYGFAVYLDGDVDRDIIHINDGIGPMSALLDRTVLVESGGFDEEFRHAEDWALWIRLSRKYDFVHVRAVTAAYSIRDDGSNMMQYGGEAMLHAMRRFVTLDDLRDRPVLAALRRELIATMERTGGRAGFPQPPLRFA